MKLITFSITNFRSITKAHKINLEDITVLLGKNNEGKSNIIKALSIGMNIISNPVYERHIMMRKNYYFGENDSYFWKRDFPILFQNRSRGLETIFKFEFELNEQDIKEFKQYVNSRINGTLEIQIKIGSDNIPKISVPKRGNKSFEKKVNKIREFVSKKIIFNYIPAIRTEEDGINIIRGNLSKELAVIEEKEEYKNALKTINNLQQEILDVISEKIKKSLIGYIPTIKNVKLHIAEESRVKALRRDVEVIIDDGTPTKIEYKGDGIKSLVSMGILTDRYNTKESSIIAIDEPESHLHPGAISELNKVIRKLKKDSQVIITTHNSQFVDVDNLKNNIIVDHGKAIPSKNIEEIRSVLGIKISDYLYNKKFVLIVEGENDKKILYKILRQKSPIIQKNLDNGDMIIHSLNGAGKLEAYLNYLKENICKYYVLLDNDDEGRNSIEKSKKSKLLLESEYNLISYEGMKNTELEDAIKKDIYINKIEKEMGIIIDSHKLNGMKNKWSDKMKSIYEAQGKLWNHEIETKIKWIVSSCVDEYRGDINGIINNKSMQSIELLINNLEKANISV
mgnify:CR=1 FL=1